MVETPAANSCMAFIDKSDFTFVNEEEGAPDGGRSASFGRAHDPNHREVSRADPTAVALTLHATSCATRMVENW